MSSARPSRHGIPEVVPLRDDAVGLTAVVALDDLRRGPGFGGVRYKPYPDLGAATAEAQRLASAMTLKHTLAELPYGGAKSVIVDDGRATDRHELLARFGQLVADLDGAYIPGVDMGTTLEDMRTIRDQGARAFCADAEPSGWTARGVLAAIVATVEHLTGSSSLDGITVAVQGVGSVGGSLVEQLAARGASIKLADADGSRAAEVARAVDAEVLDTTSIVTTPCDVFTPCAVARVVTAAVVDDLRCRAVAGAANDTLDDDRLAGQLTAAGIVYVPDFVANAGGVIQVHGLEEGWTEDEIGTTIDRIGARVRDLLRVADHSGTTPLAVAYERAGRR